MNNSQLCELQSRSYHMLINGMMEVESQGKMMCTINPATAEQITSIPDAGDAEVDAAVKAAQNAHNEWASLSFLERRDLVLPLAKVLRDHSEELGALDSLENGNVFSHMKNDAAGGAYMLEYFCAIGHELKGESTQLDNHHHYTRREPYGVVAKMLPFNHPIQSLAAGLAPPLLTGNCLVIKPSPHTSLSALRFGELIKDHLPPGTVNIISGGNDRVAQAMLNHPGIPRVSVTGSTEVGKLALRAGADWFRHTTLELGGKTPMIVFDDADIDLAVETAMAGMNFKWQGHSCSSTSRVLVHRSVHARFVENLREKIGRVNVAMPFDPDAEMGPVSHQQQFQKVRDYIDSGKDQGATLTVGGQRLEHGELARGYFLSPAMFTDVAPSMRIAREEIYGPVISIMLFDSDEEAIEIANSVEYGLAAVIMSNDLNRVHSVARKLQSGFVEVNGPVSFAMGSPFGGFKSSGMGREGNLEELVSYTQLKSINIQLHL